MKILLIAINAKYIHSNPAVYSLRAFAQDYREEVEIAEFTINQYPDEILAEIYRRKPDVAAFSCYIWNLTLMEQILGELPKVLPGIRIWAGGPEVTYDAENFLKSHPSAEGVMVGEGEETFLELLDCFHGKRRMSDIRGLCFRREDGSIFTTPPRPVLDMNRIPFLYAQLEETGGLCRDGTAGKQGREQDLSCRDGENAAAERHGQETDFTNRIMYYESSRGCPFSCSYCLSSVEKQVRFRNPETVVRELQFFLDRRVPQVKFVDRTFNCRHSHALAIWRYLREHDNGVTNFHFEIAADLLNEEELELLGTLRPGLVQLEIGVQSVNPDTIREIDRIMDFSYLSRVVRRIQAGHNIHQHLDLIAGLPWENFDSFAESFNQVYHLYPDQLQLGFLKVLKGSKMRRKAADYGLVYRDRPVYEVLSTNWISYEELLRLKSVGALVELYYNSGQFTWTIRRLEREFESPFAMYLQMADYEDACGGAYGSQSRLKRLEILRGFIRTVSRNPVYDQLLLLDLYLRENSKSRPAWAPDQSAEKQKMLEFYRREENLLSRERTFGGISEREDVSGPMRETALLREYQGYSARQMMHMTHLEWLDGEAIGFYTSQERTEGGWLLFDYRRRDPLNHNAKTAEVLLTFRDAAVS